MARNNNVYVVEVEGTTTEVTTLKEAKALTGISAMTTKDVLAGKYPMVTIVDKDATADLFAGDTEIDEQDGVYTDEEIERALVSAGVKDEATMVPAPTEEDNFIRDHIEIIPVGAPPVLTEDTEEVDTDDSQEEDTDEVLTTTDEDTDEDTEVSTNTHEEDTQDSDIEYPEVGYFEDEKAIKKYIKKLSNDELQEWCELEGATWKPNDHESINRMRMAMAIKAVHFPELAVSKGKSKKKSKYGDYTTEQLVEMAMDNDVAVPDDKGDLRICRMYTIMALRKAGVIE